MYRGELVATLDGRDRQQGGGRPADGDRRARAAGDARPRHERVADERPARAVLAARTARRESSTSPRCRWRRVFLALVVAGLHHPRVERSSRPGRSTGPCRSSPTAPCSRDRSASESAILNTILQATPLVLGGLAVGIGFKAGLFNIGGHGPVPARRATARPVSAPPWRPRRRRSRSRRPCWPGWLPAPPGASSPAPSRPGRAPTRSSRRSCSTRSPRPSSAWLILGPLLAPGFSFGRTGDLGNSVLPIILGRQRSTSGSSSRSPPCPLVWWLLYRTHPRVRDPERRREPERGAVRRACGRSSSSCSR